MLGTLKIKLLCILTFVGIILSACATQQAMTVETRAAGASIPKYKNAIAVRTVTGGQVMNVLTVPGVTDEPFKAALESSLAANGYLATPATAKYFVDAEIKALQQPLFGLDMDVQSAVTYNVFGVKTDVYPVVAQGTASFSDSPLGVDRMRIANERAMKQNIKLFIEALR